MSTFAEVIILNCSSEEIPRTHLKDGILTGCDFDFSPKVPMDDLRNVIQKVSDVFLLGEPDAELKFRFVDEKYRLTYYQTDAGKEYFNLISGICRDEQNFPDVEFNDCDPVEFIRNHEFKKGVLYIIISYNAFENEYDFFNYLGIPMGENIFVKYNVRNLYEITESKCYYDFFKALPYSESNDFFGNQVTLNKSSVRTLISNAVPQVKFLKKAGLFERERFIADRIPPWVLNIDCAIFSAGIIHRYGLYPTSKYFTTGIKYCTKTVHEKFQESADYRYQILDIMCQVLAKQAVNLGIAKNVTEWREFNFDLLLSY